MKYRIITDLAHEMDTRTFDSLEEATDYGRINLPSNRSWEVRDEYDDVIYTHYVGEEATVFDMNSFGSNCPMNWEEIADYLNALLNEKITDDMDEIDIRDLSDSIWEAYCAGDLDGAPAPSDEPWEDRT